MRSCARRATFVPALLVAATAAIGQTASLPVPLGIPFGATLSSSDLAAATKRESERASAIVQAPGTLAPTFHLPQSLTELGGELKFGTHRVVSSDGEHVIALMRETVTAKTADVRATALKALKQLSNDGSPEAQTFIGFAFEVGLFGGTPDSVKALPFYKAAAARDYQPAVLNLALGAAYGRGRPRDVVDARALAERATHLGFEPSFRACGWAAFLSYRSGDVAHAADIARGCQSPLASLTLVAGDRSAQPLRGERLDALRNSVATGADDGYRLLEEVATRTATSDVQLMHCKYALVNRFRNGELQDLREAAAHCVDQTISRWQGAQSLRSQRDQLVAGISAFVPTEIGQLAAMRKSNHFHFSWPLPYLPFRQQDVDLFANALGSAQ